ncbi:uncharacterized protein LOC134535629 [Bacillus rossius redtenbacheri]|uniref:uncharacterized protein LOC134535629 n=1 Tax=Bacillus rossius redtenbacheri TaxID=93214 RepID=UPI002FDDB552
MWLRSGSSGDSHRLEIGFLSWPMLRYKREVLFGWVDLLVSFGGIAGLFLGFSLLSGVELLYYFSVRALCMVYRDAPQLRLLLADSEQAPSQPLDLGLKPYFLRGAVAPAGQRPACQRLYVP